MPAADELDIQVRLLPTGRRYRKLVLSAVSSLLSWGPSTPSDSEIAVVDRASGALVGTIPYEVAGTLDAVQADASAFDRQAFLERWGLSESP